MKIIKAKSYQELSRKAAALIAAQVTLKPNCVLGLATGSTPIGTYDRLAEMHQKGELDFSRVTTFNLDEYVGLSPENPQSYHAFMQAQLFGRVNLAPERCHVPDGCAENTLQTCREYDEAIARVGGLDLQLLGIGGNGHIAFNEPGDAFVGDTHIVTLEESTIRANRRFFQSEEQVPRQAITMGIRSIMQSRKILLIADGEAKKAALEKALFGSITPQVPASILQIHPDLTVICHVEE